MSRGNGCWAYHLQCLPQTEYMNNAIAKKCESQDTGTNGGPWATCMNI